MNDTASRSFDVPALSIRQETSRQLDVPLVNLSSHKNVPFDGMINYNTRLCILRLRSRVDPRS